MFYLPTGIIIPVAVSGIRSDDAHDKHMIISFWKSFSQSAHFLHKLSAEMLPALLTY